MRWLYLAVICVFAAAVIIFAAQNLETVAMPFLGFSATQFDTPGSRRPPPSFATSSKSAAARIILPLDLLARRTATAWGRD